MGLQAWFKKIARNKRKKENKPKKEETRKLQNSIKDDGLTKQASTALNRIHFWSKIQSELRTHRLYMVTESRIKQKKLQNQLKLDSKLHELEVKWCCEPGSMDEVVSKIHQRGEATNKRERAMAYAFSHQWKVSSNRCFGQAYYDVSKENCGWSWMERWIAVCPWEVRVVTRPIVSTRAAQTKKQGKKIKHVKTKMLVTLKPHKGTKKGPNKAKQWYFLNTCLLHIHYQSLRVYNFYCI